MQEENIKTRNEILQLSDIVNEYLKLHKEIIEVLTFLHLSIKESKISELNSLPINNIPIYSISTIQQSDIKQVELNSKEWINNKVFEELINGIAISIKKAYQYIKLFLLIKERTNKPFNNEEEMLMAKRKIHNTAEKAKIPNMIEFIETFINKSVKYSDEVKSINKARNCLVHRNGIVHEIDTNTENKNELQLKTIEPKPYANIENKLTPINFEIREKGFKTDKLIIVDTPIKINFKLGERITIDTENVFNIGYTFHEFALSMMKSIKSEFETRSSV